MINKLLVFKSITWRITATTTTLLMIYFLTGELKLAGSAALVEVFLKTAIYYLHESIWDRVSLKKRASVENGNEKLVANR